MFDFPDAKRVRREDLHDPAAEAWRQGADETVDADLQARLHAQIAESLGLLDTTTPPREAGACAHQKTAPTQSRAQSNPSDSPPDPPDDDDDARRDEFEFRLFSSRPPARVTLEDDDDAAKPREGAIANPRPPSFYLASHIPRTLKNEYRLAAVSGEHVMLRSHRPSWGMAYPWRVVTGVCAARGTRTQEGVLSSTGARGGKGADADAHADEDGARPRKRPGKRTRVARRRRERAERERQEAERRRAVDKEEHVREKKKRLNRLKKLRKRAKNKEMKAGGKGDDGA
ncbi:hypothetical protein E4U53_004217, partial [Claviceps sorghi]